MSSTFMIETPFMFSELKSSKSSVCVAGGASSNTLNFGVFQLHTKRLGERMQTGLGGAINPVKKWAMKQNANPDETFMIAASDFVSNAARNWFHTMRNRAA